MRKNVLEFRKTTWKEEWANKVLPIVTSKKITTKGSSEEEMKDLKKDL